VKTVDYKTVGRLNSGKPCNHSDSGDACYSWNKNQSYY